MALTAYKKIFTGVSLACALCCGVLAGCGGAEVTAVNSPITFDAVYAGKTVDACDPTIRAFINNRSNTNYTARTLYNTLSGDEAVYHDKQPIVFKWSDKNASVNQSYTFFVADNRQFNDPFTIVTSQTQLTDASFFVPGKTYYYKVTGSETGESRVDSFTVKNDPVRFINAGAMQNVRDMGGWTTADGKRVKYGLLYRAGSPDKPDSYVSDTTKAVFNYLGIKSELDLRGEITKNMWDENGGYKCVIGQAYENIFINYAAITKDIFIYLSDRSNYPLLFHCNGGADRTGTLAYLINGLLGVPYQELCCDFELTSFSFAGLRSRSPIVSGRTGACDYGEPTTQCLAWAHKIMLETYGQPDSPLSVKIEEYLKSCGVTQTQIDAVKDIMLQD